MDDIRSKLTKPAIILAGLSVLVLVILAITTQFSYILRTETTATNVSIVVPKNGTILVGTSGTYPFLQDITYCKNDSATREAFASTNFTVIEGTVSGGSMNTIDEIVESAWENETVNCTITYLADSTGQATADTFTTGITYFATLTGLLVLGIVGIFLIQIFRKD